MSAEVIHGDCLDAMPTLPAASIDLVCADLPYGTTACKWDTVIPFAPLWAEYRRLLKSTGVVVLTASQPFTSALVMSNPAWFRYEWVWDKRLPSGYLSAKRRPMARHESVLVFAPRSPRYNPQMRLGVLRNKGSKGTGKTECYGSHTATVTRSDQYYPTSIIEISNANRAEKVHPTQKPLDLIRYLIRTHSNPGDLVLDNSCGSGTTGVACVIEGRDAVLIDESAKWVDIARRRIADAQAQMVLGVA
jgi:site-specific DNA-methyltransferase (adenine-specific)